MAARKRNKSAKHRAALKAKHRTMRARKCGLLVKKRAGGRLQRTPRGKKAKANIYG